MTNKGKSFGLVDPLTSYSGLALFPNTFGSLPNPPRPTDSDDPNHIHEFLRSLALESPAKCLDQAKAVLSSSSEILNSKMTSYAALKDTKNGFAANDKGNPQERRPALGRKRARFSMKPDSSQPNVNLEPSLDIDKLKGPEEFFLAYEKAENAKKEIQKQMGGVLMDLDQYNLSRTARHRRPGLLGKTSQYRHHQYSSVVSKNNEAIISSQETRGMAILRPNEGLQRETSEANVASQERELPGSTAKPENRVNGLLDELLSISYNDLDGDGVTTLLQECLQIKPISIEKLSFEGVNNTFPVKYGKENECSGHGFASPSAQKSPFASISSLLKSRISQQLKSLTDPFAAHNIHTSPVRNSGSDQVGRRSDQFDTGKELRKLMIDENGTITAKGVSPCLAGEKSTALLGKLKNHDSNGSRMDLEDNASGIHTDDYLIKNAADVQIQTHEQTEVQHCVSFSMVPPLSKVVNGAGRDGPSATNTSSASNNPRQGDTQKVGDGVGPSGFHVDLEDNIAGSSMGKSSSMLAADMEVYTNKQSEAEGKFQVVNLHQEAEASSRCDHGMEAMDVEKSNSNQDLLTQSGVVEDNGAVGCFQSLALSPGQHIEKEPARVSSHEPRKAILSRGKGKKRTQVSRKQKSPKESRAGMNEPCEPEAQDGTSEAEEVEQYSKAQNGTENVQETTKEPINAQGDEVQQSTEDSVNAKRKERKRKELPGRQSLAGAGGKWEAGLRRSTRIRTRPLEYWKGERFLYARIHNSLATVIGMKYVSPSKDSGNPTVKVKSFVTDEYKELLEHAALH